MSSRALSTVIASLANMTYSAAASAPSVLPHPQFAIHSTFRDARSGRQLLPDGLEWGLSGDSHLAYVPISDDAIAAPSTCQRDTPDVRLGILHAHNRWLFAKDLPYKRIQDIETITIKGPHFYVKWKDDDKDARSVESRDYHEDIAKLIAQHASTETTQQVWINGRFHDHLTVDNLERIVQASQHITSRKLCFKSTADNSLIRIDRYFRGGLYHRQEVFDHILDNLIALEDVEIVDNNTIIGTATLPDWIMGGMLTSRLYIQEQPGKILFLRPLYNDDIKTSDRRFELIQGQDDAVMIEQVKRELHRLRTLATLPSPYSGQDEEPGIVYSSDESVESTRSRQHRRNRRKFFGL